MTNLVELTERLDRASRHAAVLHDRSARLWERNDVVRASALATRARVRARREADHHRPWFFLVGRVEDVPVSAEWRNGRLRCDDMLRRRAEIVVALGDRFSLPEHPQVGYRASVEGPQVAVLLTVMRAVSRIDVLQLQLGA